MNQDSEIDKIEASVRDFYEIHGRNFSATRRVPWGVMRLAAQNAPNGGTLIDVGAGNARLSSFLPNSVRYVAVEPSSSLRDEALRYLAFRPNAEIRAGALPRLPCKDEEADAAACFAVLHHIPGRERRLAAVREMARILKSGGVLVLTVWNLRSVMFFGWKVWLTAWLRMSFVKGGGPGDIMKPWRAGGIAAARYIHAFTLKELRGLFDESDWEVLRAQAWGDNNPEPVWLGRNLVIEARRR